MCIVAVVVVSGTGQRDSDVGHVMFSDRPGQRVSAVGADVGGIGAGECALTQCRRDLERADVSGRATSNLAGWSAGLVISDHQL